MSRIAEPAPTGVPGVPVVAVTIDDPAVAPAAPHTAPPRRRHSWVAPLVGYVITVFVLITFNFAIPRLMPGNPVEALLAFGSPTFVDNAETRAELAKYYGLDKSIPEQYVHYLNGLAHGDLGNSIYDNRPISDDLGGKVAWSFLLIISSTIVSVLIGIPLGVHSGWKRGKRFDKGMLGFFISWQNLPIIILAAGAFVLFAAKLKIVPYGGGATAFNDYTGLTKAIDVGRHLALPALIMGFDLATYEYLVMRSSMVGELGSDYLLGGRAKGLRERRLKYRYAGRNALLPVVSVIGLQFGLAITSVIFVERIFAYPGIGQYLYSSITQRDYPAMQAAFLVLTLTVVTVNLFVDLLYRRLDPRVAT